MKRFATRGGREFKSGSYFRSHRGDNAISAFTRNDLSERVRQRAFRPDVSVVVEPSSPFFLIDFLLPLSLFSDITLRLNGTGETVLLSLLSSNRIIRKMAETIAKYSRLITDRRRRQKRRGKGKKRFDSWKLRKITRKKETYRSFWGGKKRSIPRMCVWKNANPITILLFRDCYRRVLPIDPLIFHSTGGERKKERDRSLGRERERKKASIVSQRIVVNLPQRPPAFLFLLFRVSAQSVPDKA